MIAKLVCSRHKPGQQTVVFNEAIPKVFKYTSINEVRNLGGKLGKALMEKFDIKVHIDVHGLNYQNRLNSLYIFWKVYSVSFSKNADNGRIIKNIDVRSQRMFSGSSKMDIQYCTW